MKTKIESHDDEVSKDKKFPKSDPNHTCLAVISFDSGLKNDGNYYPQVPLKKCKFVKKKVIRHINDNLSDFSSSDESDNSDKE